MHRVTTLKQQTTTIYASQQDYFLHLGWCKQITKLVKYFYHVYYICLNLLKNFVINDKSYLWAFKFSYHLEQSAGEIDSRRASFCLDDLPCFPDKIKRVCLVGVLAHRDGDMEETKPVPPSGLGASICHLFYGLVAGDVSSV